MNVSHHRASASTQQQRLRDRNEPQLVLAVREHARRQREHEDGKRSDRRDEPDEKRIVRELEREPALGHRLHPRADERQRLADPEQPKVPVRDEHAKRVDRWTPAASEARTSA